MKLVTLSANRASFRKISFNPTGLTLILGDGAHSSDHQEGDSNGVGKTLALRLIHHCLGGQKPPKAIAVGAPDWIFRLDVSVGASSHRLERTGDGKLIALDEREIRISELRSWLNQNGGFSLKEGSPYSFRSLFPRFSRPDASDCINPVVLSAETPSQALQRTLYLLNGDDQLAWRKEELKNDYERYRNELKLFNDTPTIRDVFTAGHKPTFRLKELGDQIPRLRTELAEFVVAEDYREVEAAIASLTAKIRQAADDARLKEFEFAGIREAKIQRNDITKDELLSLYEGLENIFQPAVLRHFDEVEAFQVALVTNRTGRLAREESRLESEINELKSQVRSLESARGELIDRINGKRALEEYATISRNLAALEEERRRLESYVQFDQITKQKMQDVRLEMVRQDALALQYAQAEPLAKLDSKYRALVHALYPDATAGISLVNNDGANKLRFNLDVLVQGQDSDGIGNARVICFDWLLFTGARPNELGFLWHDNRLFADLDPKPRAAWFSAMLGSEHLQDHQYIASLNSENFESMIPNLTAQEVTRMQESVALTLQGDRDSNRLMGIRFG